jgi:hypothetical protein
MSIGPKNSIIDTVINDKNHRPNLQLHSINDICAPSLNDIGQQVRRTADKQSISNLILSMREVVPRQTSLTNI